MDKYIFKINDITPDTMPFGRLLEYYSEIKKLLGMSESLHLVSIFNGSHATALAVDRNAQTTLSKRLMAINDGSAPQTSMRAKAAINAMLKEDSTSGNLFDPDGNNVIAFPGKKETSSELLSVRETATFVGELYHLAGTRDDVRVRIATDSHGVVFGATTKEIARSLRDFLFEEVRVNGRGVWSRTEAGAWEIDDFHITDFCPVQRESLRAAVDRIRALKISWPEDTLVEIDEIEERHLKAK